MRFQKENNYTTTFFPSSITKTKQKHPTKSHQYLRYKSVNQCCFSFCQCNILKQQRSLAHLLLIHSHYHSTISRHTRKYTYVHTRHKSCSFSSPWVLCLLPPVNSHPLAKSQQMKWGNSGLQDTLKFSLKMVKSQITGIFPLIDSHNVT